MNGRKLAAIPHERLEAASALTPVHVPQEKPPVVGITYLEILSGEFSLKELAQTARSQKGKRDVYKELAEFLDGVRRCRSMQEVISQFTPRNGPKNKDSNSRKKMAEIQKKYNVETSDMVHLHCKRNGKSAFVLHGFIVGNRFEIVWLDPMHQVHPT